MTTESNSLLPWRLLPKVCFCISIQQNIFVMETYMCAQKGVNIPWQLNPTPYYLEDHCPRASCQCFCISFHQHICVMETYIRAQKGVNIPWRLNPIPYFLGHHCKGLLLLNVFTFAYHSSNGRLPLSLPERSMINQNVSTTYNQEQQLNSTRMVQHFRKI